MMKTALTIAGSDSSGGAGIQADLKTMIANGVYGMSAITALTAQNTTGVQGIFEVTPEFLEQEIDSVFTDIRPDAVKIGMVSSAGLIKSIAKKLHEHKAENIVVDPVMVATSGSKLISDDAIGTLKEYLFPMAAVLTPNIPETEVLSGMEVKSAEDMIAAAKQISETYHCAVLCNTATAVTAGSTVSVSTTRTPTEPAAPYRAPSPPIWRRVMTSIRRWNAQRLTSPERWQPCWTSDMDPDRWITDLIFAEKDLRRNTYDDDRTPFRGNKGDLGRL